MITFQEKEVNAYFECAYAAGGQSGYDAMLEALGVRGIGKSNWQWTLHPGMLWQFEVNVAKSPRGPVAHQSLKEFLNKNFYLDYNSTLIAPPNDFWRMQLRLFRYPWSPIMNPNLGFRMRDGRTGHVIDSTGPVPNIERMERFANRPL